MCHTQSAVPCPGSALQCPTYAALHPAHAGAAVVGTLRQPLDFTSMRNQTEYLMAVQVGRPRRWCHLRAVLRWPTTARG